MRKYQHLVILTLAITLIFAVSQAGAQEKGKPVYPVGTIQLESTSIAAGVGVTWGKGTFTFEGKSYPISVQGINVAGVGISTASATGDVFNLKSPNDIAGVYAAGAAGIAIAGGAKGMLARNDKGVVIDLRASQQGVSLSLGPEGFTIKMK
jgi:hypothetical protein